MVNKLKLIFLSIICGLSLAGCSILNAEPPEETTLEATVNEDSVTETEATQVTIETESSVTESEIGSDQTEDVADYILGDLVFSEITAEDTFNKLIESGVLGEEVYMLSWATEVVSDGVNITKDGITEAYHIEGVLDISLPFTDLLNQMDEQKQIDVLNTIAETYQNSIGVDVVRLTCDGESIITDLVNYDVMILEPRLEEIKPELIDEVADEAYIEEEDSVDDSNE